MVIDRVECLGQVDEYLERDLERGGGAPMTSSETRFNSGEGTVGFELICDLFVNLTFEDFRKAGQDGYRSVTVWV